MLSREDIDAVIVATYSQAHRAPVIDALAAGKHVMVEKPMAGTLDDALQIARAARLSESLLMVAQKWRFAPEYQALDAIIETGMLGDIYYAECNVARRWGIPGRSESLSGSLIGKETAGLGVMGDFGVYGIDMVLRNLGYPRPTAVSAVANNLLGKTNAPASGSTWGWTSSQLDVEDFAVTSIRVETGALILLKTAWIMHMDELGSDLMYLGTKGGAKVTSSGLTIFRCEAGLLTDSRPPQLDQVEGIELFRREHLAFADAIRERRPSPVPADRFLLTNVIVDAAMRSVAAGREVEVSIPAEFA